MGQDGKGILSLTEYYAASNNSSACDKVSVEVSEVSKTPGVDNAVKNDNGYYTVNMNSIDKSYSLIKLAINVFTTTDIVISCINYAESNFDYMLVSKISTDENEYKFAEDYQVTNDSAKAEKDFKTTHSANPVDVTFSSVAPDQYYVYIKIRKDVSTTKDYETFAFKCDDVRANWQTAISNDYGPEKPYLWNYTRINYTDGTSQKTEAQVISCWGKDGGAGRGIASPVSE